MITWNNIQLLVEEKHTHTHTHTKVWHKIGPKISFIAIFSSLHYLFSLILHRIAAWDNFEHLLDLKPQKKNFVVQIRA